MTPARLAANRRNALKSTGPRTARGKANSRLNGLRHGMCSPAFVGFWEAFIDAAPYGLDQVVKERLTPEQVAHPVFARAIDLCGWVMEHEVAEARIRRESGRRENEGNILEGAKPESCRKQDTEFGWS
jgi:hypothetical protein